MTRVPPPDSFGVADNCNPATVDYFIEVFGYQEAIELSNIESPTGNSVDYEKIQIALNDAAALINNYIITAPPQGKILIAGSYRRTQATIARWYLDVLRPRQQVIDAAQSALQQLELWASRQSPSSGAKWQEAYRYWNSNCSMTRSSYQRGKSFTEASLNRWVLREGGNNRWWMFPRKEAMVNNRENFSRINRDSEVQSEMPESILEVNRLFDSLETTRDLGSFTNTSDVINAEDGDSIIASNAEESENGEFKPNNGLRESNTF